MAQGRIYGFATFGDYFTDRQLVALTTFSDLVGEAREKVLSDAVTAGVGADPLPLAEGGSGAQAYADAVATYLGLGVSRMSDICNSLCRWESSKTQVRNLYTRQAIPMVWDFAEPNIFARAAGDYGMSLTTLTKVLDRCAVVNEGKAKQIDAASSTSMSNEVVVATDPPYYDNIAYADLSDFFYVWLRRTLGAVHPDLFKTLLTPKANELVATPYRFGGDREEARRFFETGLGQAIANMREAHATDYPMTVFYAYKQAEIGSDDGGNGTVVSTGWETMLSGIVSSGFAITGTWPVRSELANRMLASGANALASSIVLACRPRPNNAPMATRRDFTAALKRELVSGRKPPLLHEICDEPPHYRRGFGHGTGRTDTTERCLASNRSACPTSGH